MVKTKTKAKKTAPKPIQLRPDEIAFWGRFISKVKDPEEAQDVATKNYVDTHSSGGATYTAGDNITIENNVISATDTTYSNFTGTDGETAGAAGLVPAPATTDTGKYLKADGTWDNVSAGPTVVQTTGTSQADVMSQAATSNMIFPSGSETSKANIAIGNNATATGGSLAISYGQNAYGASASQGGIVIGVGSSVYATKATATSQAVAIGYGRPRASGTGSVAIGANAYSSASSSIALGADSATGNRTYVLSVGSGQSGYSHQYRQIINVGDPEQAHDAANKNYVDTKLTYATTEQVVGTWIDGKPIYRRVVSFSSDQLPSNSSVNIADVSSWNIDMAVDIRGMIGYQTGHGSQSVSFRPLTLAGGGTDDIRIDIDQENLRIRTYSSWSGFDRNFIIVEYTKTTS